MRITSTTASAPYSTANVPRLNAIVVVDTLGELASTVFSRPNTIHGWRPTSVSTHPASAATYGSGIAATPTHSSHGFVASVRRR